MSISEQINKDYIEAYKAHDESKVSVLRMLKSALKNAAIAQKSELNDEETIKLIKREVKQRQDAAAEYIKGDRPELANKEEAEVVLLKSYLPEELTEAEINLVISETINEVGREIKSQPGRLIGLVVSKTKGRADGSVVARLVQAAIKQ